MRISFIVIALSLLASPAYADKLKVVASFSILGDMVRQVGGDDIDLKVLVGPDSDAHEYEPTPSDAQTIGNADVVIVNGLGFEGWLGRLIVASGYTGTVVNATQGIEPLTLGGGLYTDPHAWQSLPNAKTYVINIRKALVKADQSHAGSYRANAGHYLDQIDELNARVTKDIAAIPENKRKIVSTHDAFQYFAHEYHVTFIAPLGVNPESSVSAADMVHIIDEIRNQHVQALFFENISDPRLIKQLESETGAYVGGTLYSDALSKPDGPAAGYLTLFAYNVAELTKGMVHNQ